MNWDLMSIYQHYIFDNDNIMFIIVVIASGIVGWLIGLKIQDYLDDRKEKQKRRKR